jgi:hypothetical protein
VTDSVSRPHFSHLKPFIHNLQITKITRRASQPGQPCGSDDRDAEVSEALGAERSARHQNMSLPMKQHPHRLQLKLETSAT